MLRSKFLAAKEVLANKTLCLSMSSVTKIWRKSKMWWASLCLGGNIARIYTSCCVFTCKWGILGMGWKIPSCFYFGLSFKCNVMYSVQMRIKPNVAFQQMSCGLSQVSTNTNAGTECWTHQLEPRVTHTRKIWESMRVIRHKPDRICWHSGYAINLTMCKNCLYLFHYTSERGLSDLFYMDTD